MDKEFVIGTLFDKPNLKWIADRKFDKSKDLSQEQTKEFDLPLVNAKNGNNGIMYFGRSTDFSYVDGGIDIVNDGAVSAGNVYPQPHKIGVLYNAYIITLKNDDYNTNRPVLEYLSCVIEKNIKHRFSYSDKAGWDKVKEIAIPLPIKVDENGNPIIDDTHFYHEEGFVPDFDYMQERIEELEQERIEELEQYLVATGLNDYELTDEDIETLSLSGFGHYEERDSEDAVKVCKEFKVSDIARVEYGNKFDKNKMTYENPSVNFVSRTASNNGISDFVDNNGTSPYKSGLITLALGGSIGSCFLQEYPFYTGQNVGVIDLGDVDYHAKIYFTEALGYKCKKTFTAFGNEINKHLKTDLSVPLPIQTDAGNNPIIDTECKYHPDGYIPDWDFMEKYIKAIEKIVIADVVQYKDAMISKTKEVVA